MLTYTGKQHPMKKRIQAQFQYRKITKLDAQWRTIHTHPDKSAMRRCPKLNEGPNWSLFVGKTALKTSKSHKQRTFVATTPATPSQASPLRVAVSNCMVLPCFNWSAYSKTLSPRCLLQQRAKKRQWSLDCARGGSKTSILLLFSLLIILYQIHYYL